MKSVSRLALPLAFIILLLPGLAAQEDQSEQDQAPETESPILGTGANESAFKPGEALFSLQLGTSLPLFFWNPPENSSDAQYEKTNLYPGGLLAIRYMGFVATGIALGGEIGASYSVSVARRNYFMVPMTFEAMWMGARMPFEFPMGLGVGMAISKLGDYLHIDPLVKPEVGVLYRASPSWSFGLLASYLWIPQIYSDAENTRFGNFMTVNLSVFNHL